MRSKLAQPGISPGLGRKLLGHQEAKVVDHIYDRHSYGPEKLAALERLKAHLLELAGK